MKKERTVQPTSERSGSTKPLVSSSADILKHIGVTDATVALRAFALLKVAGYIPQDKFELAMRLAVELK